VTLKEINDMLAINFFGVIYCVYPTVRQMLQQNSGHIVLVSTFDAKKGIPPDGAYSASKFAITGFLEVLRQELHGTGVSVTSVFPSRVDTTMTAGVRVPFLSPKVRPEVVAERTVTAIKRKKKEVFVPFWGPKMLQIINTLSPTASDWLVRAFGLSGRDGVSS
jgi:short-subunit dehydrogenase